jgi:hypothetical protein
MNPDGSGKAAISLDATGAAATPSRLLHGGKRWFLQWHETGRGFYRDGRTPRVAMFAVDETGANSVQLTDDMGDVVPQHNGWQGTTSPMAWVGLNDEKVSYQGYTLAADGQGGLPAQWGVWYASVAYDAVTGAPAAGTAASTLVPGMVTPDWYQNSPPYGYSLGVHWAWSPDGSELAYDEWDWSIPSCPPTGMWRIGADGSGNTQYFDGTSPRYGRVGSWSTKGRIAFSNWDATAILAMNPDGSNATTVVPASHGDIQKTSPRWSPAGNYLVYLLGSFLSPTAYVDIRRVAANGGGDTSLTGRLAFGGVVDWR